MSTFPCTSARHFGSIEYSLLWLSPSAHVAQDRAANMGKKSFSEGMGGGRAVKTTARVGNTLSALPGDWKFRMLGQKEVKKGTDRKPSKMGATSSMGRWSGCFVFSQGLMDDLELMAHKEP